MAALKVDGTCDPAFAPVRDVLKAQLADGRQFGAAVAVRAGDRDVVDIWGGHADPERSRPWAADTVTCSPTVPGWPRSVSRRRPRTSPTGNR